MKYLIKNTLSPLYHFFKNPYEREFYRLMGRYGKEKRYQKLNDVKFLNYRFDVPDALSFIYQFKEIFVEEIYKFKTDYNEPIIYDCGANIGTSIIYFKKMYPNSRIKAFEADPEIVKILMSNLMKSKIDNVEIIDKAVWIDNGKIKFRSEGADGGSIFIDDYRSKMIEIETVRLKDHLAMEERIDFLKLDIEGAEHNVIKDCRESLKNVQYIFVEYHSLSNTPQNLSEILEIFELNNFRYYIENVSLRKHPFIFSNREQKFDLQLNIFAVKDV